MKIILDDKAYILCDRYNCELFNIEPKNKNHLAKDNAPVHKSIGYYPSPIKAMKALVEYRLKTKEATVTIDEYYHLLHEEYSKLHKVMDELDLAHVK